jgi:hypothetical protein
MDTSGPNGGYHLKNPGFNGHKEAKFLLRRIQFNQNIIDRIIFKYEKDDEAIHFRLYENIPIKVKLFKLIKYRKAISNFIQYQVSIKANTYVERKILRDTDLQLDHIMERKLHYFFIFPAVAMILSRSSFVKFSIFLITYHIMSEGYLSNLFFMFHYNDILMNMQINSFYKLGRETSDMVKFLNNNRSIEDSFYNKKQEYYNKFFVNEIHEVNYEPEDELFNYLDPSHPIYKIDFHKDFITKIERERRIKESKMKENQSVKEMRDDKMKF